MYDIYMYRCWNCMCMHGIARIHLYFGILYLEVWSIRLRHRLVLGCANAADRERVDRFLRKLHRAGYSHKVNIDAFKKPGGGGITLKSKKNNECHVLRPLSPPLAQHSHSLN